MKKLTDSDIQDRLKKIKLLILDVDGVLTDGHLMWIKEQGWTRRYHVKDGYGIQMIRKLGMGLAVITAATSEDVQTRVELLGIEDAYFGQKDKLIAYEEILKKRSLKPEETCYVADELFDIPVLERVGFSVTVPHAVDEVKSRVHYITEAEGGKGAVREVIEAIRKAQRLGDYLD